MSAHMTANPEGATHGLVDDRESALHVLLYMSIRHLAHNKANSYEMLDLLNMFDGYIEIEGSPYRKGTMSKRHFIISGGKELDFEIQVMNELIQHLCEQFSARYTSSTAKRSIVPLIAKSDAEQEAQALDLKSKLYNISEDSQWLYHLLRTFAAYLPIRSPVEIDYIDNTKLLKPNRKRVLADDLCDEADGSKLISTHDSMAGSIDPNAEVAPPVETPPRKKQRSSRK